VIMKPTRKFDLTTVSCLSPKGWFSFRSFFKFYLGKYATRMWHRLSRKLLAISWKGSSSTNSSSTTVNKKQNFVLIERSDSQNVFFSSSSSSRQELQINQHTDPQPSHPFDGRGCRLHCIRPSDSIRGQVSCCVQFSLSFRFWEEIWLDFFFKFDWIWF
jgi:hypothetical protein